MFQTLHRPRRGSLRLRQWRGAASPAGRVYWYSLIDLSPAREAIEGFHVDENEYHLGLVDHDGNRKPAWEEMKALLCGGGEPPRGAVMDLLERIFEVEVAAGVQTIKIEV